MRRRHAAVGAALLLVVAGVVPAILLTSGGAPPEQPGAETRAPPDPPLAQPDATIPTTPEAAPEPSAAAPSAPPDLPPEPSAAAPSAPPDPPLVQPGTTTPTTPEAAPTVPPAAAETDATPEVTPEQPIAETSVPPEPPVLSYTRLDPTGQATTPGSYAFLDPTGHAVTTYEGLRDGTATALRIHQSDASSASQAALYDPVAAGDILEWRAADDCWVRYEVTEVKPDPAGTAPRKLLAVEWASYAFTGCAGTVATDTPASITVDPPSFFSPTITTPVRYGPYLLIPFDWTSALEEQTTVAPPDGGATGGSDAPDGPEWPSDDPTIARQHPLWNEPTLPEGWGLVSIWAEDWYVEAIYHDSEGYGGARIWIARQDRRPRGLHTGHTLVQGHVEEVRTIDGHPAYLRYHFLTSTVYLFDETAGVEYFAQLFASSSDPDGRDIEDAIALARSLYQ